MHCINVSLVNSALCRPEPDTDSSGLMLYNKTQKPIYKVALVTIWFTLENRIRKWTSIGICKTSYPLINLIISDVLMHQILSLCNLELDSLFLKVFEQIQKFNLNK